MIRERDTAKGSDRLILVAVVCAILSLAGMMRFLWVGFGPRSMGMFMLSAPLLAFSLLLYLVAVLRDLKQRRML